MLFSHGLSGSARNWRATITAFPSYTSIAYDVRGHARSDVPSSESSYGADRLTADMEEILDDAGLAKATCVGLSMGAALSLMFALRYPERINALVLTSLPNVDPTFRGVASYAEAFASAIRCEGLEKAGEKFVWGAQSGLSTRDASLVRLGFLEHKGVGIANMLAGFLSKIGSPENLDAGLASINMPVLLVSGSRDLGAINAAERLDKLLPSSEHRIVSNCGHLVNIEKKKEFNDLLLAFFSDYSLDK